jgi:hypothetical protein
MDMTVREEILARGGKRKKDNLRSFKSRVRKPRECRVVDSRQDGRVRESHKKAGVSALINELVGYYTVTTIMQSLCTLKSPEPIPIIFILVIIPL